METIERVVNINNITDDNRKRHLLYFVNKGLEAMYRQLLTLSEMQTLSSEDRTIVLKAISDYLSEEVERMTEE